MSAAIPCFHIKLSCKSAAFISVLKSGSVCMWHYAVMKWYPIDHFYIVFCQSTSQILLSKRRKMKIV